MKIRMTFVIALVLLNAVTLFLYFKSESQLDDTRQHLVDAEFGLAMTRAELDFKVGYIRYFEVETWPITNSVPLASPYPTGRTYGPFQIWYWPRYARDNNEAFWLRLDKESAHDYNQRMTVLYQIAHKLRPSLEDTNIP